MSWKETQGPEVLQDACVANKRQKLSGLWSEAAGSLLAALPIASCLPGVASPPHGLQRAICLHH